VRRVGFVAFVLSTLVAGAAQARDDKAPADFSGLYLGLETGYGFGASGDWCYCSVLPPAVDAIGGEGGITVAAEAGYGMRFGLVVIQAAARAGFADIKFSEVCVGGMSCHGEASWLAQAQVSAGLLLFADTLVAGSLGYAVGDVHAQAGAGPADTSTHDGHVLAARVEQGMSQGWRMGLEYRHYDMAGTNEDAAGSDVEIDWASQSVALVIRYELGD
jgi:hypothetical protein